MAAGAWHLLGGGRDAVNWPLPDGISDRQTSATAKE